MSYLEIYNERVYDLLTPRNQGQNGEWSPPPALEIKADADGAVYVPNCVELRVRDAEDVAAVLWAGARARAVTATDMNLYSSRSHTIFTIGIERGGNGAGGDGDRDDDGGYGGGGTFSKLCLVDLAGSEKVRSLVSRVVFKSMHVRAVKVWKPISNEYVCCPWHILKCYGSRAACSTCVTQCAGQCSRHQDVTLMLSPACYMMTACDIAKILEVLNLLIPLFCPTLIAVGCVPSHTGTNQWDVFRSDTLSRTRIREMTAINASLSCLGNCIAALRQHGRVHVPYRDAKLTRLLQVGAVGTQKMCMWQALVTERSDFSSALVSCCVHQ